MICRGLIIPFICVALTVNAQSDSISKTSPGVDAISSGRIYSGEVTSFTVDNLGNIYVLTPTGLLKKINSKGDSLNVFNDVRRFGMVYTIDVTNPLKVLLYYKDFSTAVMLDRFLNRINTIDFRKSGIFQAKAIGLSYDNNVWIFDEQSAKLKKIGDDGKVLSETVDLRQVLDAAPSPEKIIDRDGFVYMYDPANGIYIFDYYGALKNTLPITGIRDIQVLNKTIAGRKERKFVRYTPGTLDLQEIELPPVIQHAEKTVIMQHAIYVLNSSGIEIYPYQ